MLSYISVNLPYCITLQMLDSKPYDTSVDWWSMGVILYRLLVGEVCKPIWLLYIFVAEIEVGEDIFRQLIYKRLSVNITCYFH